MQNDTLYNRIMAQVKEMIAEAGGGSSLPEVTADDNGDVLTVVAGEWAKAALPTGQLPDYDVSMALAPFSYNDILERVENGIIPWYVFNHAGASFIFILNRHTQEDENTYIVSFGKPGDQDEHVFYAQTPTENMIPD